MANKANWYYSARENRWRLTGKAGSDLLQISDAGQLLLNGTERITGVATFHTNLNVGSQARAQQLLVGSGSSVNFIRGFVATLVQDAVVASGFAEAVGTLQSATGSGVGVAGINVADFVFGVSKIALTNAQLVGFRVPTTDTLLALLTTRDQSAGSLAAGAGFDVFQIRAS